MKDKEFETLINYLKDHEDSFVIFGGAAVNLNLQTKALHYRETKDLDIILFLELSNTGFDNSLCKLINDGGYRKAYTNERKVAYRFVSPTNKDFPKIIELFTKEDESKNNIHRRLRKIDIVFDDSYLSAITINNDVYDFVKKHKIKSKYGIPVVDILGLIALKSYAYFET